MKTGRSPCSPSVMRKRYTPNDVCAGTKANLVHHPITVGPKWKWGGSRLSDDPDGSVKGSERAGHLWPEWDRYLARRQHAYVVDTGRGGID